MRRPSRRVGVPCEPTSRLNIEAWRSKAHVDADDAREIAAPVSARTSPSMQRTAPDAVGRRRSRRDGDVRVSRDRARRPAALLFRPYARHVPTGNRDDASVDIRAPVGRPIGRRITSARPRRGCTRVRDRAAARRPNGPSHEDRGSWLRTRSTAWGSTTRRPRRVVRDLAERRRRTATGADAQPYAATAPGRGWTQCSRDERRRAALAATRGPRAGAGQSVERGASSRRGRLRRARTSRPTCARPAAQRASAVRRSVARRDAGRSSGRVAPPRAGRRPRAARRIGRAPRGRRAQRGRAETVVTQDARRRTGARDGAATEVLVRRRRAAANIDPAPRGVAHAAVGNRVQECRRAPAGERARPRSRASRERARRRTRAPRRPGNRLSARAVCRGRRRARPDGSRPRPARRCRRLQTRSRRPATGRPALRRIDDADS